MNDSVSNSAISGSTKPPSPESGRSTINGYNMWHVIRDQLLHPEMLKAMEDFFTPDLPTGVNLPSGLFVDRREHVR